MSELGFLELLGLIGYQVNSDNKNRIIDDASYYPTNPNNPRNPSSDIVVHILFFLPLFNPRTFKPQFLQSINHFRATHK